MPPSHDDPTDPPDPPEPDAAGWNASHPDLDDPTVLEPDDDGGARFEITIRPRAVRRSGVAMPAAPIVLVQPNPRPVILVPSTTTFPDPIPHILPHGSIATLNGASGVGKTALIAGWVKQFQTGGEILGHRVNAPVAIGMLAVDRPWRDHQQWFNKAGCTPFRYYALRDDPDFNWNQFRDWRNAVALFTQAVDRVELPPGGLLIVDPLPLFIPGRLIDYKDVAIGLALLDKELSARQLTMIGVFHVAKQKANKNDRYLRPQDRILGSGGQIGYSETAIYLLSPDEVDADYYEVGWIPHQIKAESFRLNRDEQGLFVPYHDLDLLGRIETAYSTFQDDLQHAASIVMSRIMRACSCSEATAKRYLQKLVADQRVVKIGRGHYQRQNYAVS